MMTTSGISVTLCPRAVCDQLLSMLNGWKHLIIGNNDPETTTPVKPLSLQNLE